MSKKSLATSPANVVFLTYATAATVSENTINMIGTVTSQAISVAAPMTDGIELSFVATSTNAPVITFTGSTLQNGVTANRLTATLANVAGSSISVVSYGSKWYLVDSTGTITYGA